MITRSPANALFWKYCGKKNTRGIEINTVLNNDGSWTVSHFKHPDGLPVPTNTEIEKIIDEYETHLELEKINAASAKNAVLAKLNITEEEAKILAKYYKEE